MLRRRGKILPFSPDYLTDQLERLDQLASEANIQLWEGFPVPLPPMVLLPSDATIDELVNAAIQDQASLIYVFAPRRLEGADTRLIALIAGYPRQGIIHALAMTRVGYPHELLPMRTHGATVEFLVEELVEFEDPTEFPETTEELESDLGLVGLTRTAYPSYQDREYSMLNDEHRNIVDEVLEDPDFEPYDQATHRGMLRLTNDLSAREYEHLSRIIRSRFHELIGNELDRNAQLLATRVLEMEDFSPFMSETELATLIKEELPETEGRLQTRVLRKLRSQAWQLRAEAERTMSEDADKLIDSLDPRTRDMLGFASRWARRETLLDPVLSPDLAAGEREALVSLAVASEEHRYGDEREQRFATAGRALLERGETKAATARRLGVSTSILDRLLRQWDHDIEITESDYLREVVESMD